MDLQWISNIPPVTRYWSFAILLSAALVSTNVVKKMSLVYLPERAFAGQYWRFFTSFCYFSPMSIELLLSVMIRIRSVRYLEESHFTKLSSFPDSVEDLEEHQTHKLKEYLDRYKSLDYLYFVFLICCSLLAWVTVYYYRYGYRFYSLGDMLDDILLYIWCRSNPHLEVSIFGVIKIPTVYLPWLHMTLSWMMSDAFLPTFVALMEMKLSFFSVLYGSPFFWKMLICYSLSHMWWFIAKVLPDDIYYEADSTKRKLRRETFKRYNAKRNNFVHSGAKALILPPWYWIILRRVEGLEQPVPAQEH